MTATPEASCTWKWCKSNTGWESVVDDSTYFLYIHGCEWLVDSKRAGSVKTVSLGEIDQMDFKTARQRAEVIRDE